MTRRIGFAIVMFTLMFAAAALAADISGNWTGSMSMGDNQFTLSYTFKVEGEKLTGSIATPQGDSLPLMDGKISGDKITFYVTAETPNGPVKFLSEGTVKGADAISMSTKMADGTQRSSGAVR